MSGLIQCPFDPYHQIAPNKFGKHLTKCQRQHPDVHLARCPLNTFHYVKPDELKEHVRTCPSRMELEAYKYSISSSSVAPSEEVIISTGNGDGAGSLPTAGSLQADGECWDDCNYEAYNPLGKCKQQKEQNHAFIIPCANKFVVPNVSAAMIKKEFQKDTAEEGQPIKEEAVSEGDHSPSRSAVAAGEETPATKPITIKSEHSPHQAQVPFRRGNYYDAPDRSSDDKKQQHYQTAIDRDGSSRERYHSNSSSKYSDNSLDRDDRKRGLHTSSSRSHEEHRHRPYYNPHSQNRRQPRDQNAEASNRFFKVEKTERQD